VRRVVVLAVKRGGCSTGKHVTEVMNSRETSQSKSDAQDTIIASAGRKKRSGGLAIETNGTWGEKRRRAGPDSRATPTISCNLMATAGAGGNDSAGGKGRHRDEAHICGRGGSTFWKTRKQVLLARTHGPEEGQEKGSPQDRKQEKVYSWVRRSRGKTTSERLWRRNRLGMSERGSKRLRNLIREKTPKRSSVPERRW